MSDKCQEPVFAIGSELPDGRKCVGIQNHFVVVADGNGKKYYVTREDVELYLQKGGKK